MTLRLICTPLAVNANGVAWYKGDKWMTLRAACQELRLPFWIVARDALKHLHTRPAETPRGRRTRVYALTEVRREYLRVHASIRAGCILLRLRTAPPPPNVIEPTPFDATYAGDAFDTDSLKGAHHATSSSGMRPYRLRVIHLL